MLSLAICPYCRKETMLDDSEIRGFCTHCGQNIDVKLAISMCPKPAAGEGFDDSSIPGMEKARQFLLMKDYEQAKQCFDMLLASYPQSHEVLWGKFQAEDGLACDRFKGCIVINGKILNLQQIVSNNQGGKLGAIKQVKDITGFGLRACKLIIDAAYPRTGNASYEAGTLGIKEVKAIEDAALGKNGILPPVAPQHLEYADKAIALAPEQRKHFYQGKLNERNNEVININIANPSGGCYIATAVYGSYEAPEVLVLRRFRDRSLQKYVLGRWFIHAYYWLSPSIAQRLQYHKQVNKMVRGILDRVVGRLSKN